MEAAKRQHDIAIKEEAHLRYDRNTIDRVLPELISRFKVKKIMRVNLSLSLTLQCVHP